MECKRSDRYSTKTVPKRAYSSASLPSKQIPKKPQLQIKIKHANKIPSSSDSQFDSISTISQSSRTQIKMGIYHVPAGLCPEFSLEYHQDRRKIQSSTFRIISEYLNQAQAQTRVFQGLVKTISSAYLKNLERDSRIAETLFQHLNETTKFLERSKKEVEQRRQQQAQVLEKIKKIDQIIEMKKREKGGH